MNLLLDTHVLLWWASEDPRLGSEARAAVARRDSRVHVSAVTAWEITIKVAFGRLTAPDIPLLLRVEGFRELPLTVQHGVRAGALPVHHRDPFDRALVAQAAAEGLTLVTADSVLAQYDVDTLDART